MVGHGGPTGVRFGAVDPGDLRGFGVDVELPFDGHVRPDGRRLPLAHTVGAWLLRRGRVRRGRGWVWARPTCTAPARPARSARRPRPRDGSARRSVKAPVYLDDSAGAFDAAVARALATGDADALAGLDLSVGERLLAAGVPTWRALGAALAGRDVTARLHYDDAPFGVGYLVADWVAA